MDGDKKKLETVFPIVICSQFGDKWQSKTLFLTIIDLSSSNVFVCRLSDVRFGYNSIVDICPEREPFSRDSTIPHLDLSHFPLCIMGN